MFVFFFAFNYNMFMPRRKGEKLYLYHRRDELIWFMGEYGYKDSDLAIVFNLDRSTIGTIMRKKPRDWMRTQKENQLLKRGI